MRRRNARSFKFHALAHKHTHTHSLYTSKPVLRKSHNRNGRQKRQVQTSCCGTSTATCHRCRRHRRRRQPRHNKHTLRTEHTFTDTAKMVTPVPRFRDIHVPDVRRRWSNYSRACVFVCNIRRTAAATTWTMYPASAGGGREKATRIAAS